MAEFRDSGEVVDAAEVAIEGALRPGEARAVERLAAFHCARCDADRSRFAMNKGRRSWRFLFLRLVVMNVHDPPFIIGLHCRRF